MPVRRQAECINDVGAEQIGVADSECLSQAVISGLIRN